MSVPIPVFATVPVANGDVAVQMDVAVPDDTVDFLAVMQAEANVDADGDIFVPILPNAGSDDVGQEDERPKPEGDDENQLVEAVTSAPEAVPDSLEASHVATTVPVVSGNEEATSVAPPLPVNTKANASHAPQPQNNPTTAAVPTQAQATPNRPVENHQIAQSHVGPRREPKALQPSTMDVATPVMLQPSGKQSFVQQSAILSSLMRPETNLQVRDGAYASDQSRAPINSASSDGQVLQAKAMPSQPPIAMGEFTSIRGQPIAKEEGTSMVSAVDSAIEMSNPRQVATSQIGALQMTATAPSPRYVAQQIVAAVTQQAGQLTEVALNPVELGRVRMALTAQDAAIVLMVQAERPETADLMRRHIDVLAQEFRQLGYGNVRIEIDNGPSTQAGSQNPHSEGGKTQAKDDAAALPDTSEQTITVWSADGGLDLRI